MEIGLTEVLAPRPVTKSAMNKLGRRIRKDGIGEPEILAYGEISRWYNNFSGYLEGILRTVDWEAATGAKDVIVSARAKRLETTAAKLARNPDRPMANIVDLAGIRVEGEMTLQQQDKVVRRICWLFGLDDDCVHDLRTNPHAGYRAVHIRAIFDDYDALAEIQVRTRAQGAWANAYEELGEALGRGIRYGETEDLPKEHLRLAAMLQRISVDTVAKAEEMQNSMADSITHARQVQGRMLRGGRLRWLSPRFWHVWIYTLRVKRSAAQLRGIELEYTTILGSLRDEIRDWREGRVDSLGI
jgi:ppGpp synthetase/RelA/SpoT-type nucleotidyltranferase